MPRLRHQTEAWRRRRRAARTAAGQGPPAHPGGPGAQVHALRRRAQAHRARLQTRGQGVGQGLAAAAPGIVEDRVVAEALGLVEKGPGQDLAGLGRRHEPPLPVRGEPLQRHAPELAVVGEHEMPADAGAEAPQAPGREAGPLPERTARAVDVLQEPGEAVGAHVLRQAVGVGLERVARAAALQEHAGVARQGPDVAAQQGEDEAPAVGGVQVEQVPGLVEDEAAPARGGSGAADSGLLLRHQDLPAAALQVPGRGEPGQASPQDQGLDAQGRVAPGGQPFSPPGRGRPDQWISTWARARLSTRTSMTTAA